MQLYRGFSNVEEAFNVLKNKTAGGVFRDSLSMDYFTDVIEFKIKNQKGGLGEGAISVTDKSKDRGGIIEYTLEQYVARCFGTLCVIGGEIDLSEKNATFGYNESLVKRDREQGVFCRTDLKIDINIFEMRVLDPMPADSVVKPISFTASGKGSFVQSGPGVGIKSGSAFSSGFGFSSGYGYGAIPGVSGPTATKPAGISSSRVTAPGPKGAASAGGRDSIDPDEKLIIKFMISIINDADILSLLKSTQDYHIVDKINQYLRKHGH